MAELQRNKHSVRKAIRRESFVFIQGIIQTTHPVSWIRHYSEFKELSSIGFAAAVAGERRLSGRDFRFQIIPVPPPAGAADGWRAGFPAAVSGM